MSNPLTISCSDNLVHILLADVLLITPASINCLISGVNLRPISSNSLKVLDLLSGDYRLSKSLETNIFIYTLLILRYTFYVPQIFLLIYNTNS